MRPLRVAAALGVVWVLGCLAGGGRPESPRVVATPALTPAVPPTPPNLAVSPFDPALAPLVLSDPRLAAVWPLWLAADYAAAAERLEAAIAIASVDEAPRWYYQLGRLYALAGDASNAARAFDRAADVPWPLASYARLGAAQAFVRAGWHDEGIVRAEAVPEDLPITGSARLLEAEALEAKHDHERAASVCESYLARGRHPPRWIEAALRAADAILATQSSRERTETAAKLARRVLTEAPTSTAEPRALAIDRRAVARIGDPKAWRPLTPRGKGGVMLPSDWADGLGPDDQVARAASLFDAQRSKEAEKALYAFVAVAKKTRAPSEAFCRAEMLLGHVYGKKKEHAKASAAYDRAIEACEPFPDALVESLYWGAKASAVLGRPDEALERFGRVEKDFHGHRYADDARLRGAQCALDRGDEQRFETMLSSIADDYPQGDMAGEGLFRLALRRMAQEKWDGAKEPLTRGLSFDASESPPGRFSYFRARVLGQLGDTEGECRGYEDVIRSFPLSYYMLHAYGRLAELDPARAKTAVDAAKASEPRDQPFVRSNAAPEGGAFARGLELVRQGENELARRELAVALSDAASDVGWAVAVLYGQAGLVREAHQVAKSRLTDWLSHYPVGRWKEAWTIAFPRPYASVVERAAQDSGIPFSLAYAVMREESAFDPDAVSPSHAYGLMQLIEPTAKTVAKELGLTLGARALTEPATNVKLGCRFLADLRTQFAYNPHLAVSAYNAGPAAPGRWQKSLTLDDFDLWVEQIPFDETRRYTKRVLTSFAAYSFLYEKEGQIAELALPKRVQP
jgi:soluble lytic murein transglycosylase